jgi:hypothetical protein
MKIPTSIILAIVALALAVLIGSVIVLSSGSGSGSDNSPLLHMRGQDITEANLRSDVRSLLSENDPTLFCALFKGLSASGVVEVMDSLPSESPSPSDNSTPMPDQTANPADRLTYAQILIDECARIGQ